MDFYAWQEFFQAAGLGPNASSNYAHIFSSNKLERSHLPHLNREVLGELNISIMGHILLILKHARLVSAKNWPIGLRSPPSPIELSEEEVDDNLEPYPMPPHESFQGVLQDLDVPSSSGQFAYALESTALIGIEQHQLDSVETPASTSTAQHSESDSRQEIIMQSAEGSVPGTADCNSSDNMQQALAPKKEESTTEPVDSMNGDEDTSEANSSLLPTPVMPQNWLDPCRKPYDSGNEDASSEMSDTDEEQNSTLQNKNGSGEMEEQSNRSEQEVPPLITEKICSPLLPTPVMPQNWLDPCKKTDDNNFVAPPDSEKLSKAMQPKEIDNANLPGSSFDSEINVNLDANYLSSTSCPTFMEPLSSQTSVFLSEDNKDGYNSQPVLEPAVQQYAQYSAQPIQERNFQPKISPPWNKQARQTQPYYRPQPQSAYGVSSYSQYPNERNNAPGSVSTSSGYTYNSQPGSEKNEAYPWNY